MFIKMKEKQGSILRNLLLPLSFACIVILLMIFGFSNKMKTEAVVTFERSMTEIAESYAQRIQTELQTTYTVGITVAGIIVNHETRSGMITQSLSELVSQTELYAAEYYTADQKLMDQDGQKIDASEREFFSLINMGTEPQYLYLRSGEGVKEDTILIVTPESEEAVTLLLYYPVKRLRKLVKLNREFDQMAFASVITAEGEILSAGNMKSQFLAGENLFDSISTKYYNKTTAARVKMQNGNSGCMAAVAGEEARTLIYAPLKVNDWVLLLGVNQSYVEAREAENWNETSQMLYQFLAVIVVCMVLLAVANIISKIRAAQKSKVLEEKANTDLLTGLNNKLATERGIKEYLDTARDTRAMLFVVDIDNFKKINDTMGHAFGDEVLRAIGKRISSNFRVTDIVGRTGGDEFIILLKDIKEDANIQREAHKLMNFFHGFHVGEYVKYSVTASVGVAIFPADGQSFETLYKSADSALYKAKKQGKNQLAFFDNRDF